MYIYIYIYICTRLSYHFRGCPQRCGRGGPHKEVAVSKSSTYRNAGLEAMTGRYHHDRYHRWIVAPIWSRSISLLKRTVRG